MSELVKETNFERVLSFMNTFNQQIHYAPQDPGFEETRLRMKLILEELIETFEGLLGETDNAKAILINLNLAMFLIEKALNEEDIDINHIEVADGLTDLLYVVYGGGGVFGYDLDATFKEVHGSNMSKVGEDGRPIKDEFGKVVKGPNYYKPDLAKIIKVKEKAA